MLRLGIHGSSGPLNQLLKNSCRKTLAPVPQQCADFTLVTAVTTTPCWPSLKRASHIHWKTTPATIRNILRCSDRTPKRSESDRVLVPLTQRPQEELLNAREGVSRDRMGTTDIATIPPRLDSASPLRPGIIALAYGCLRTQ